jgi:DNA topoisomerase-1
MAKNLVIVESPAKAKTIEGYLGKDFVVKSSYGHVRDLPSKDDAIDVKNGFKPTYEISKDKKEIIRDLKKLAKTAEVVWLASDDDREGEAISWHLNEALNLDDKKTRRIVFREITKKAILNAIENPRGIDIDLVHSQQARRILDRLVGFELSPILWKKVKYGLSAGRVQSVTVRLVVEREREIEKFISESYFKSVATFNLDDGKTLKAELNRRLDSEKEANSFLSGCIDKSYEIASLETKPATKRPAPPFTTSTLQQEAGRKLGFSVAQTMSVAQRLYEAGKISYMRTDSVNLSDTAVAEATEEISNAYGANFVQTRKFKTKSQGAQEAHEAVRPTNFANHSVNGERNEQRLYELIWKRAIASQMADAKLEKTTAKISIEGQSDLFYKAQGQVIKFEGFLKVYLESSDEDSDDEENKDMLPPLSVGQFLELEKAKVTERFTRHPARYSEAALVKKLEELGIGRPSTYAPTISTVQKRGYVIKEQREGKERKYKELSLKTNEVLNTILTEITGAESGKMYPSDIAMVVNDFLVDHFPKVTSYSFTAEIEEEFDRIAEGQMEWDNMLQGFYKDFHLKVESSENIDRRDVNTDKTLGTDPKTGLTVITRLGRYGAIAQIGTQEEIGEDQKPQYAGLLKGQLMETITLDEALELFKLPRDVGMFEEKKVVAAVGRFGPYIRHDSKFVSIKAPDDPLSISASRAIELIREKREADAKKFIKGFDENEDVSILMGRWGPYIKWEKKNVKIPKDTEAANLTFVECKKLADATPDKKGTKKAEAKKKPSTKKSSTKTSKKKVTAKKTSKKK